MAIRNKRTRKKTRRKIRDLDQVKSDILNDRHLALYKNTKSPEELPAMGRHYCVECARWFDSEVSLVGHRRGKPHRRRVKALKEEPYTQKEAEAAIGLRTDNGNRSKEQQQVMDIQ